LIGGIAAAQPNSSGGNLPTEIVREYEPVAYNPRFGQLKLSIRYAAFSLLEGHMDLELDERISTDLAKEIGAGARALRVLNADDFFQQNRGKGSFCRAPIKWLVIHEARNSYLPGALTVFLFEGSDLYAYRRVSELCDEAAYTLRGEAKLWSLAGNPGALTADNAIAYQAARATANDLLYGSQYNFDDPTTGATYFYSTTNNAPPAGFFTNRINSGRLRETYRAGEPRLGEFRFLLDTQP
jgi:hypothetical protein